MKKVNVVLLNYCSVKDTIECIESINSNMYENYRIIVVDNYSTDNSVEELKLYLHTKRINYMECSYDCNKYNFEKCDSNAQFVLIRSTKNDGFASGNNIGINFIRKELNIKNDEYVWILNNDTVIDKYAINELIEKIKVHKEKALLGSTILEYYDNEIIQTLGGYKYDVLIARSKPIMAKRKINEIDINVVKTNFFFLSGCSVFGDISVFEEIGDFSEDYFLYYEDTDLSMKAKEKNIQLLWCEKSIIYHKQGGSIGSENIKRKRSEFSEYQCEYSSLVFSKKWYKKIYLLIVINRYILKVIQYFLRGDIKLIKSLNKAYIDFFKGDK